MVLPIQQFQILTPDQANPLGYGFGQGIKDMLRLQQMRSQGLQNQGLQSQLPYMGPEAAANVQNLLAESQARQAQAGLTNFQTQNPAFINPEASALTGIGLSGGGASSPSPYGNNNGGPIGGSQGSGSQPGMQIPSLGGGVAQGGQGDQSIGTTVFNPRGGSSAYRAALASGGNGAANNSPYGQQAQQSQQQMQKPDYGYGVQTPNFTTTYSQNPTANQFLIHRLGLNPVDQQNLQLAQKQKQMNIDNYNDALNKSAPLADAAFQNNQNIDEFVNSYNKLGYLQKGTIGGHNIPFTSEANQTDQAMSKMIGDSAKLWQQGHVTNADIDLTAKQKLGRSFNPEAVSNISSGLKAYNNRAYEYQQFMQEANAQRVPYQSASLLWDRYNQLRPAFNSADNLVNSSYKGTWQDFLTPDAVANPGTYTPPNQGDLARQNPSAKDIQATAAKHGMSYQAVRDAMRQRGAV